MNGLLESPASGTNRVIEMCRNHGAAPPVFEEKHRFLVVTFRAQMAASDSVSMGAQVESKVESWVESVGNLEDRIVSAVRKRSLSKSEIAFAVGKKTVDGQLHFAVRQMIQRGLIEYTLPDKPNSRLQKYRLTLEGEKALKERGGEDVK
jgi:predicted HTH transcriptional regulator